ncbi:unnamed protein product, partial [Rotaria magnacalcarata]
MLVEQSNQRNAKSLFQVKTPEFVNKPTTQEVKQSETAVFEAKVDGYPIPK